MELKRASTTETGISFMLLIVPYGIETYVTVFDSFCDNSLLIVPYGIETLNLITLWSNVRCF